MPSLVALILKEFLTLDTHFVDIINNTYMLNMYMLNIYIIRMFLTYFYYSFTIVKA